MSTAERVHDARMDPLTEPAHPAPPAAGDVDDRRPVDRFEQLFNEIDDGYCLCEIITDESGAPVDYRFLETNRNFEEMTGLVDAVGKTALEMVPDLEHQWIRVYGRAAAGERIRFQQGSEAMGRWYDVFTMPVGEPGQFAIVFRDETLRHRALLKLQAGEERYRTLAERERQISLRLQRALMPSHVAQHPAIDIDVYYEAGSEVVHVGGDWFDTFEWHDEQVGVLVGDVVGHGLEAAAAMGRLSAAARALAPYVISGPAALLDRVSSFAAGPNGVDYLTACCVVLDAGSGRLSYAHAGHPAALLIPPDGPPRWLSDGRSGPLGALVGHMTSGPRPEGVVDLEPGSRVLLYTDGLVERRDEIIDVGLARLMTTVSELMRDGAHHGSAFCATLVSHMVGAGTPIDDIIALSLYYHP